MVSECLLINKQEIDLTGKSENIVTRMAGDERRQQIIETAESLFSENGFRGTTTKKIADKAGISEAMVFKHFANKDELYSAILDQKSCSRLFTIHLKKWKRQFLSETILAFFTRWR